jgi:pimeloyl-ACP methyl ester carboxylesterase
MTVPTKLILSLFIALLSATSASAQQPTSKRPRVLLIGDSISIGYTKPVIELLKEKADVHRVAGNAGDTGRGLKSLSKWLDKKNGKWDVIHFNWGLWDLCYRHPDATTSGRRDKINGTITHSPEQYRDNLNKLVVRLEATGAKLIWASITPVPEGEVGRKVGDDLVYNRVAAEVMAKHSIPINDLHALMVPVMKDLTKGPGDVHFTAEGSLRLAKQVASAIEHQLADDEKPQSFPGEQADWHGFNRFDFEMNSHKCIVVTPNNAAADNPWVWRARFFGHEPQADIALLNHGFHVVYCDVANLFGSPTAVARWNAFYEFLTTEHDFSRKVALEGMSRGGLIIYNWAAANPEKVACIYGDAPVCDFKSWPGGKGTGKGSDAAWKQCLAAYGFTLKQALEFEGNPLDNLQPLAKANIPLLNVVGDADEVVPVSENTAILAKRYRELGGSIQVIGKPGIGHHPHSLNDPTPIVEFIIRYTK